MAIVLLERAKHTCCGADAAPVMSQNEPAGRNRPRLCVKDALMMTQIAAKAGPEGPQGKIARAGRHDAADALIRRRQQ